MAKLWRSTKLVFSVLEGTVKLTDLVSNQRLGHSLSC